MSTIELATMRRAENFIEEVLAHHWSHGRISVVENADLDGLVLSAFSNFKKFGN